MMIFKTIEPQEVVITELETVVCPRLKIYYAFRS
jgi:hypothetical protein